MAPAKRSERMAATATPAASLTPASEVETCCLDGTEYSVGTIEQTMREAPGTLAPKVYSWIEEIVAARNDLKMYRRRNNELETEREAVQQARDLDIAALSNDIEHLEQQLRSTRATMTVPTPAPAAVAYPREMTVETTASAVARRSEKQQMPPMLTDGKDPKFENWLYKVRYKLRVNHDRYPDTVSQIGLVISCCSGKAEEHLAPRLRRGAANPFHSADEILDFLETVFGDPNRLVNAIDSFHALQMRGYDFDDFLTEFVRLANEAEIPEAMFKRELNRRLTPSLAQAVAPMFLADNTFPEFTTHCSQICRLRKLANDRRPPQRKDTPSAAAARPSQAPSPMPRPVSRSPQPSPTINPATGRPRPSYDDPLRAELSRQGKCFYCHRPGHMSYQCPDNPKTGGRDIKEVDEVIPEQDQSGKGEP